MKNWKIYVKVYTKRGSVTNLDANKIDSLSKFIDKEKILEHFKNQIEAVKTLKVIYEPLSISISREDYANILHEISKKQIIGQKMMESIRIFDDNMNVLNISPNQI